MEQVAVQRRRKYKRYAYSASFRLQLEDGRVLPARSVNLSSGGMLLNVLAHQELFLGQSITIHLDSDIASDVFPDLYLPGSHDLQATIVRLECESLATNGYMRLGVQFLHERNANETAFFE